MMKYTQIPYLFSLGCSMTLALLITLNGNSQIYEATRIEEHRVAQYDTLNVYSVKEFLFHGKSKELVSIKKYDTDGFIIERSDYSKEGKKRSKKTVLRTYTYNSNRTERTEVWRDPIDSEIDTTFVVVETYSTQGNILSKIETRMHSGEIRKFEYGYDDHGNCESIRVSESYGNYVEYFKNDYDKNGRITRQVHTHRIGTKYEHLRAYNRLGQIKRNSTDNARLIETFTYNRKGDVLEREFKWDSTQINKEAVFVKTCVLGSDQFTYYKNGQLKSTKKNCEAFVNNENPYSMLTGEKFDYGDRGLLLRRHTLSDDSQWENEDHSAGYFFQYQFE